jgi:hypothetical protein
MASSHSSRALFSFRARPSLPLALSAVALLVLGGGAGCAESDTVVSVQVVGNVLDIQRLRATVTVGARMRTLSIPQGPRAISLPATFTVQMDRSIQGMLVVTIDALDAGEAVIASGTATLPGLIVGQRNDIAIDLTPGDGGPDGGTPDGGMDAPDEDTSGSGGAVGTGGSGGSAGGAGAGGVTGAAGNGGHGGTGIGGDGTGGMGTGGGDTGGAAGDGMGGEGAGGAANGGEGVSGPGGRGGMNGMDDAGGPGGSGAASTGGD